MVHASRRRRKSKPRAVVFGARTDYSDEKREAMRVEFMRIIADKKLKAAALAEMFGQSERTIYRDTLPVKTRLRMENLRKLSDSIYGKSNNKTMEKLEGMD